VTREPLVVVEDDRHGVLERRRLLEDHLADARMLDDRLASVTRPKQTGAQRSSKTSAQGAWKLGRSTSMT